MNPNEVSKETMPVGSGNAGTPPPQMPRVTGGDGNGKTGAIIGILVIIIILVIGGLYFWGERLAGTDKQQAGTPAAFQPEESTSDEIIDIEADLSATALEGFDTELNSINTELGI